MDWIAGWSKRIKLTIDHTKIDSDLINFPILINLDSTCSGVFNELGANSKRMSFINPDTYEQYYCEIEKWDYANQSAQLWVKVPTVASGIDVGFYMLYDSNGPDNTDYIGETSSTAAKTVWDTNFIAVYHMSQDPSVGGACILDSTSNANHGTPYGSMTSDDLIDGLYGKALGFDGINDYIESTAVVPLGGSTIETVFNKITLEPLTGLVAATAVSSPLDTNPFYILQDNSGDLRTYGIIGAYISIGSIAIDTWYSAASARNLTEIETNYFNGEFISNTQRSTAGNHTAFIIGGGYNGYANVKIREVRISSTNRSTSWLSASEMSNTDNLITKSEEEIVPTETLNYQNKIEIIIPYTSIDSSLNNFPILINLSSSSGLNQKDITDVFMHLKGTTNRKKIAITDYTGLSQCFVEIERWAHPEHSAQLWVKVPSISTTVNTTLYLYYDVNKTNNNLFVSDTNSLAAQNVWDNNFIAVYHMSREPSSSFASVLDSTINAQHGTITETSSIVDSEVGKALYFDGTNTNVLCGTADILWDTGLTLEATALTDLTTVGVLIALGSSDYQSISIAVGTSNNLYFSSNGSSWTTSLDNPSPQNTWQYISGVITATTCYLSYNDDDKVTATDTTPLINNNEIKLGVHHNVPSTYNFEGAMREVRLSNIARPDSWISATYKSNNDNLIIYNTEVENSWLYTYEENELSPWANRIKLEIDYTKVDVGLKDFPVLINLSDTSGYNNKNISNIFTTTSGAQQLALTLEDGTSQLPVEIEHWYTDSFNTKSTINATRNLGSSDDGTAGLSVYGAPVDNNTYYTFDGSSNGLYNSTDLGNSGNEVCWARVRIHNKNKNIAQIIWKDGGSSNGVAAGIDDTGNLGIFGISSGNKYNITIPSSSYENNIWYDIYFTRTRVTIIDALTGNIVETVNGNCLSADGTGEESIGYCVLQSPITASTSTNIEFFEGDIDKIEIYTEGNLIAPKNNDSCQLWTKIPYIKSYEKTILYLYYDVTKTNYSYVGYTASDVARSVWDDNFMLVCHMASYTDILDSTSNNHTMTPINLGFNTVGGNTSNAIIFYGVNERIEISTLDNVPATNTVEAVHNGVQADQLDLYPMVFECRASITVDEWLASLSASGWPEQADKNEYDTGRNFCHVVGTNDGVGNSELFLSGMSIQTKTGISTATGDVAATISSRRTSTGDISTDGYFKGSIDEIRISNIKRSDTWITVSNESFTDALIFYNSEETYVAEPVPAYFYHGYIKEMGLPVKRKACLYNNETGILIDSNISNSEGYYLLETQNNTEHFIIVMGDGAEEEYEPIMQNKLLPNGK